MKNKYTSHSLEETQKIACELARKVKIGDVITLSGDLGVGMTAFAEGFIKALNPEVASVTSPTFNLVKIYDTVNFPVWHFDLYRLKSPEEIFELGIEDAIHSGVSLIEWAEIASDFLPKNHIKVEMHFDNNSISETRVITVVKTKTKI